MEKIRTKNGTWSAAHDVLRIKNQHISPRGPSEAWIRSIMGTNQKLSSDLSISFRHWEKPTNNFLYGAPASPPFQIFTRPNRRGRQQSHHLFLPYSSIQHICITALSRQLGSSPAWLTSRNMEQQALFFHLDDGVPRKFARVRANCSGFCVTWRRILTNLKSKAGNMCGTYNWNTEATFGNRVRVPVHPYPYPYAI